jgi:uroporphyrinogen decarboxylase
VERSLNAREKFNAVLNFESGVKTLKVEYGYWAGTIRNWFQKGLPKRMDIPETILDGDLVYSASPLTPGQIGSCDANVGNYFGLESNASKFPTDYSPMLEKKILEETKDYQIFTDRYGITQKILKKGASVPMVIDTPVKNMDDFHAYKERYDDDYAKRLPRDWKNVIQKLKARNFPLRLGGNPFGFLGFPRHLMGSTNYMLKLYDDPRLIKDINDFSLHFVMNYWSAILDEIEVDCVFIFEDMSYRSGSLISLAMVREFLLPYYKKFIDFLHQYRIRNILVDSDGLVEELIPLWLEVGVSGVFPMEAVNDIVKIRETYPRLQMMGGIDKTILMHGNRDAIDRELEKTAALIKQGGYIPHIDHSIPLDAAWDSFVYYRKRLNDIIDAAE